jgi:hypothetical protein
VSADRDAGGRGDPIEGQMDCGVAVLVAMTINTGPSAIRGEHGIAFGGRLASDLRFVFS